MEPLEAEMNAVPSRRRRARPAAAIALAAMACLGSATTLDAQNTTAADRPADAFAQAADALYRVASARLSARTGADLEASFGLFREAAQLDPTHARAHAGAATAASLLALYSIVPPRSAFAAARSSAAEALRLEPELAQAHAAMGLVSYLDAWDFPGAETHLRQALRLDAGLANAWHWYGMLLYATRRFEESLAAYDRALALEPGSSLFRAKRAAVLAAAGRAAGAERELRSAIERFPESALPRRELGYLLVGDGRGEEGVAMLRSAAELSGALATNADLAWGFARTGRRSEAEAILASIERESRRVAPWLDLALVSAGLEWRDEAFGWLGEALGARDPGLVYLATAPGWEPLRDDSRFAALLGRVGLRAGGADVAADRRPAPESTGGGAP